MIWVENSLFSETSISTFNLCGLRFFSNHIQQKSDFASPICGEDFQFDYMIFLRWTELAQIHLQAPKISPWPLECGSSGLTRWASWGLKRRIWKSCSTFKKQQKNPHIFRDSNKNFPKTTSLHKKSQKSNTLQQKMHNGITVPPPKTHTKLFFDVLKKTHPTKVRRNSWG